MQQAPSRSYDIAIVGGGLAGVSLAYFLGEGGNADVAVLERGGLGGEATGRTFGGVRQQFSTPMEIELSRRGLDFWTNAEQRLAWSCPFRRYGYLFVTTNAERLALLADAAVLQRQLGMDGVEVLAPYAVAEVAPWLSTDDLAGGTWSPDDGRVNPADAITGMTIAARRRGVTLLEGHHVVGISRVPGGWRIDGTQTIRCRRLVVAAGLWSSAIVRQAGLELPLRALRVHYAVTEPALAGTPVPVTVDFDTGFCVEREGPGLFMTVLLDDPPPTFSPEEMLRKLREEAAGRAPALLDVPIRSTVYAETDLTDDGHPIVGELDEGLWVLAGFSGHGIMHGPPLAEGLARQLLAQEADLDLTSLAPDRAAADRKVEWMVPTRKDP